MKSERLVIVGAGVKKISKQSAGDRVVIVTGAGRGIGASVALRLASEGWIVGVNDVDRAAAQATHKWILRNGGRAILVVADISREAAVRGMIARVVHAAGRIDALVNNAGVDCVMAVSKTLQRNWSKVLEVDLGGAFLCVKHAEPHLIRAGAGCIVNIASIHALATLPSRAAYASAKAGLLGLTKALCVELGPKGVRVNAILPGYIRTEIWRAWLDRVADPEEVLSQIANQHPIRRIGHPDDVAGAVNFLLSPDASFMSGATLVLDGGLTSTFIPPPV